MRVDVFPSLIIVIFFACNHQPGSSHLNEGNYAQMVAEDTPHVGASNWIHLSSDIRMNHYFEAIDSICRELSANYHDSINEYELVHANRRILDLLVLQDYYLAKARGHFIYDQRQLIILYRGDSIRMPAATELDSIRRILQSVIVDVNVPEYVLRIYLGDSVVHVCPVRVGKNQRKYLALAGHEVDLRTPIGDGFIVRIERNPIYMNPVDGHRYELTRRDDGVYTKLPRIPFLEPIIAGRRMGSLFHPTTNRSTLGKAISNGCVGMSEADAWVVYYYAPLGTRVRFRYELDVVDSNGTPIRLENVYDREGI